LRRANTVILIAMHAADDGQARPALAADQDMDWHVDGGLARPRLGMKHEAVMGGERQAFQVGLGLHGCPGQSLRSRFSSPERRVAVIFLGRAPDFGDFGRILPENGPDTRTRSSAAPSPSLRVSPMSDQDLTFPVSEYEARLRRVRALMRERG